MRGFVQIVIPSRDSEGNDLPRALRQEERNWAAGAMVRAFGGMTATEGQGGWIDPQGRFIEETVTVIQSFSDGSDPTENGSRSALAITRSIAERLKENLRQSCVMVSFTPGEACFF